VEEVGSRNEWRITDNDLGQVQILYIYASEELEGPCFFKLLDF